MPRQGRIDFPGAIHHIIVRGINREAIFKDDRDRCGFLQRLEASLLDTGLGCHAWALIPNHIHLLLRTGPRPLTDLMRSLLTGYAIHFNRRHKRTGYLFQNRYKSILCQEETYLLQLVRYIHLNPLRAKIISDVQGLNIFPWCGHSVLLGHRKAEWQDIETILGRFGTEIKIARRNYLDFVIKGIAEGKRNDLTGGGLLRSAKGWSGVQGLKKAGERWRGDERILGDGNFVQQALKKAEEDLAKKEKNRASGWTLDRLLEYVAALCKTRISSLKANKKNPASSQARALLSWWATSELGYSATEVAIFLHTSKQTISQAAERGQHIAKYHHSPFL